MMAAKRALQQHNLSASQDSFDNDIIMKVEMRKFMNLVNNRIQKRNNLVASDIYRIYPLN